MVVTNLGTFSRYFVDFTEAGTNYVRKTARPDHIDLPNGQRTSFDYFAASQGGPRLKSLHHQSAASGGGTLSKFDYTYTADGTMKTWKRQFGAAGASEFRLQHDAEDQITAATLVDAITPTMVFKQQSWQYDKAGNRTSAQKDAVVGSAAHNNRNQLTGTAGGGKLFIQGHTDEAATVKVNGVDATTDTANNYTAWVPVTAGTNTITVEAKDYSPNQNTTTKSWTVSVTGGTARTLTYDFNGNMLGDGTRTYEWDAENRLVKITQGGVVTQFGYDGQSRRVSETVNGALVRRWVWCGTELCEERDGAGSVVKRFYPEGEQWVTGANAGSYYYTRDHLGSIRELTDASVTVRARYDYDVWGAREKLGGDLDASFGFTGHYQHSTGLVLALYRAYDPELGRWISEDPIGIEGGINVYGYVGNRPSLTSDRLGLRDYYAGVQGTVVIVGGITIGWGGVFDTDNWLDSGIYVTGGYGLGFDLGAGPVFGSASELEGGGGSLNASCGPIGVSITDSTERIGDFTKQYFDAIKRGDHDAIFATGGSISGSGGRLRFDDFGLSMTDSQTFTLSPNGVMQAAKNFWHYLFD